MSIHQSDLSHYIIERNTNAGFDFEGTLKMQQRNELGEVYLEPGGTLSVRNSILYVNVLLS